MSVGRRRRINCAGPRLYSTRIRAARLDPEKMKPLYEAWKDAGGGVPQRVASSTGAYVFLAAGDQYVLSFKLDDNTAVFANFGRAASAAAVLQGMLDTVHRSVASPGTVDGEDLV